MPWFVYRYDPRAVVYRCDPPSLGSPSQVAPDILARDIPERAVREIAIRRSSPESVCYRCEVYQ